MKIGLVNCLNEYIEKVEEIKYIMFDDFEVNTKDELINKRLSFTKGEFQVKTDNKYQFHGRGCIFTNNNLKIDWDFGCNENWCGINIGSFLNYLNFEYNIINNTNNYLVLKQGFELLCKKKVLVMNFGLYYFTQNAKKKNVELNIFVD